MRAILLIGLIASILFATDLTKTFPEFDKDKFRQAQIECASLTRQIDKEMSEMHAQMSREQRDFSLLSLGFLIGTCMTSKGAFGTNFNSITYAELKNYYLVLLNVLEE